MRVAVVGSGLAGWSAAVHLLERGVAVVLLDGGETLDIRRQQAVERLRAGSPEQWSPDDVALLRENPSVDGSSVLPKKYCFGSDFIYASDRPHSPIEQSAAKRAPTPTFASGGYSLIWGGAALPIDDCDMTDWPIKRQDLAPFFKSLLTAMPLTGAGPGTLADAFPAYRDALGAFDPGPQGNGALSDLQKRSSYLRSKGILFGPARQTVFTEGADAACRSCGACFAGCPYGSIFSTLPDIRRLVASGAVEYRPGSIVIEVGEDSSRAIVRGVDAKTGFRYEENFDAVFVAAGPINSTRIVLESLRLYDTPATMKESMKFVLPILRGRDAPGALDPRRPTLASAFIEARFQDLSPHWQHMQLISVNDMVTRALGFGPFHKKAFAPLLRRVMLGWCGVHSDHSSRLELTVRSHEINGRKVLAVDMIEDPAARSFARKLARRFAGPLLSAGWLSVFPVLRFSNPGSGTHCGGSLPMRARPSGGLETDIYGRPAAWKRVFVVDSAVLPSVPGTTLAMTTAANAARIAATAPIRHQD